MNKHDAISAMQRGEKVTHESFVSDEWMKIDGNGFLFEDGIRCSNLEFWHYRQEKSWLQGWSIFEEAQDCYNTKLQAKVKKALLELDIVLTISAERELATLTTLIGGQITNGCLEDVWKRATGILDENHIEW